MEIKGLNTEGEMFDENNVTVETYMRNLRVTKQILENRNIHIDEKYFEMIEKLCHEVFSSSPKEQPDNVFEEGTLFHYSVVKDNKTGEVYYDKMKSIAQNGLLPVSMLVFLPNAIDDIYVSFHSILNGEKTFIEAKNRMLKDSKGRTDGHYSSLIFFVNSNTPIIQKLKKLGRSEEYDISNTAMKDFIEVEKDAEKVIQRIFSYSNTFMPDALGSPGVCYLPIGVPSSYISAIIVPENLQNDEKLLNILREGFKNARIIDENGIEIEEESEIGD